MNTYLLLRNNKKSGPYSLQQLLDLGFKPYDLIWVEGRSAAWLYPSEVDSLKEYATATEEQPYDRFYKKPKEEKSISQPVSRQEETETLPIKHKKTETTKRVFVSLPKNFPVQEKNQHVQPKTPVRPEENPEERKTILIKEVPVLHEKYAESLDDIKKRYTETYLQRKKKTKRASMYTSALQVFGGALLFCILVVAAYKIFSDEKKSVRSSKIAAIKGDGKNSDTNIKVPENNPLVISRSVKETKDLKQKNYTFEKEGTKNNNEPLSGTGQKSAANSETLREMVPVKNKIEKKTEISQTIPVTNNEIVKQNIVNISRLVKVRANNYKQRVFGGVLDLELTVNNKSKFVLDKVVVELQYLKPSEQPLKTEKIVFNSISPEGSQTLKIPDYLRGIKVVYKITEIQSPQYERYTAGL